MLACRELDIDIKIEQYKGNTPANFVFSTTIHREMTPLQRACVASEMKKYIEIERKINKIHTNVSGSISNPISKRKTDSR